MVIKYFYILILITFGWIHDIWTSDLDEPKQNVKTYSPFENFPNEIQQHILDHLDFQSIVNYDRVCQSFHCQWNHRTLNIIFKDEIHRSLPLSKEELYLFTQDRFYKKICYQGYFHILDFTTYTFPISETYIINYLNGSSVYLPLLSKTQLTPQNFSQPIYCINSEDKNIFTDVYTLNLQELECKRFSSVKEEKDFAILLNFKNPFNIQYNNTIIPQLYKNLCFLIKKGLQIQSVDFRNDFVISFLSNSSLFSDASLCNATLTDIKIFLSEYVDYICIKDDHDDPDIIMIDSWKPFTCNISLFYQKLYGIFQHDIIHRTFMILDNYNLDNKIQSNFDKRFYSFIYFQTGIIDNKTSKFNNLVEMLKKLDPIYNCLVTVDFSHNHFNNQDIIKLALNLKLHTNIKNINLSNNNFEKYSMDTIGDLVNHLPDIEKLVLKDNRIDDEMIHILISYILRNNTLKYLDLSDNQIGNSGAKALYEMLGQKTSILEIYLNNNHCDESWLKKIHPFAIEQKCN